MPTGQIADSCVLWTGFGISIVARNYAQLAVHHRGRCGLRDGAGRHGAPAEAWLWVGVFAALLVTQSAALSLQTGVEVAYVEPGQPSARPSS
jgi:hypothetical protein